MLCLGLLKQFVYFKSDFPSCAVLLMGFFLKKSMFPPFFLYVRVMCSGEIALKINHYYYYRFSTVEMSEAEIRRNARRQRILQNSEQRLQKLAKGTLFISFVLRIMLIAAVGSLSC